MKYFVRADGEVREVELTEDGIRLDGRPMRAELARIPGSLERHLLLGTRGVAIVGSAADGGWAIEAEGRRVVLAVEDERACRIRELAGAEGGASGGPDLRAPMPGLVVRVLVEAGQTVEPGAPLLIVEAMKMENELRAEAGGRIATVEVEEGQTVNQNDLLITFESG